MKKIFSIFMVLLTSISLLAGCTNESVEEKEQSNNEQSQKLVIYSGRKEQFVLPLIEKFEQETGIKVELLSGKSSQYAQKIIEEKNNPQADLLIANDAGVMEYLRLQGVLAPNDSKELEKIPANFKSEDGSWVGVSARSRVLMYNKDLISEEEMPKSILDLADPKYKGQFAITKASSEAMVSHIAAIRSIYGDDKTIEFIKGMLANEPLILEGHTDIRKAVGAGEVKFGLVNNYYFHLQLEEEKDNNVGVIYPDQGENEMGTFVNVAGVALIKGAPNEENAKKFIEFLLRDEQQEMFAFDSKETPVLPHIKTLDYAKKINEYKVMEKPLSNLGSVWEDTLNLMEKAGYVD
ncbi:iron(III) transport system substrate-binding protein [Alkalithermobacter thermoalcaliphilus JW-YL-7 = DSM 7308]|uniref:FetB, iron (III) ABC transporter iron (III)-binding protein n=1 Tax=Alkalithermobacter thermoalcaliphilus JW-YL-7 = DSM 7308 TaxID=1121328 RepID=A0A150FS17_CLOPD|nr:fetB, iron (III) ABC transporter iron (III)-binding protein [[Clostridium] paradoxum JW-YL-7 = DSM 7308]SHK34844.1 iron(III) transport system substrate-binding protein [[Clostridium] paradoxum JW-YL-7 = DSM 7308]